MCFNNWHCFIYFVTNVFVHCCWPLCLLIHFPLSFSSLLYLFSFHLFILLHLSFFSLSSLFPLELLASHLLYFSLNSPVCCIYALDLHLVVILHLVLELNLGGLVSLWSWFLYHIRHNPSCCCSAPRTLDMAVSRLPVLSHNPDQMIIVLPLKTSD